MVILVVWPTSVFWTYGVRLGGYALGAVDGKIRISSVAYGPERLYAVSLSGFVSDAVPWRARLGLTLPDVRARELHIPLWLVTLVLVGSAALASLRDQRRAWP